MPSYTKMTYEYTKKRKNFGRQPLFQDVPAHILDSINPNKRDQKLYMLRNPVNCAVQATMPMSRHVANTKPLVTREEGVDHTEGGWPRDVHHDNETHTVRYRRRVMHDESYIHTVISLAPVLQHYLNQNNAIEMYEAYFDNMEAQEPVEKCSIHIANVFRDKFQRPVSCVQWTNENNPNLAVAYSFKSYMSMSGSDKNVSNDCYIWNVCRQTEPIHTFTPECTCWTLACSPTDPEVIITGLENGTTSIFDIREGANCVLSSSVYSSHRAPISSLLYTHTRTQTEFFTGSPDGQCLWWDCRNLSAPIDRLPMSIKPPAGEIGNLSYAEGVSTLEFDRGLPTKFLCGTESGKILNINRMGREHSEKLASHWDAHIGPVRAVQRSPCTLRMFLSCGDYSVRVWSEEVRTAPIIVTKLYRYQVMDAAWAPLRYSSYMSICAGGYFYYWDFLRQYKEPMAMLQVAERELTRMTPHSEGHSVAIGDTKGSIHLLHLSETMTTPGSRDKNLMFQTYDRERRREHILDNRIKEIRLKIRAEEEAAAAAEVATEEALEEEDLDQIAEEQYFKIISDELRLIESQTPNSSTVI